MDIKCGVFNNKLIIKDLLEREEQFLSILVDAVRKDLEPLERMTFSTMVVLNVHNKDIISKLIKADVHLLHDFLWYCSMRYYISEEKMHVQILDCLRDYGYEYLGNTGRLV